MARTRHRLALVVMTTPLPGPRPTAPAAGGPADPAALAAAVDEALAGLGESDDLDVAVRTLEELHRRLAAALATIDTA